uniref:PHD finger protein 3-like isoform X2 n=1 Tax=Petromyzon marinus TaxID=7757 RepID=A0AAJ7T4I9_PETMA|nr:PHD finger protein 3-like isoform X2 [Petromyzon marinus]
MTEKMDLSVLYKVTVFDRCPGMSSGADVSDTQISEPSSASILDGSSTSQQISHGTDGLTWELVPLNSINRSDNQGEQGKEGTQMDPLLSCDQMEVELVPLDVELVPVEIQLVPAEEEEPPVAIELVPVEEGCGTFSQPPGDSFESIETYTKMLSDKDPMFTAASTPYHLKYHENLRDSFSLASAEGEGLGLDDAMVESLLKDGSLPIIEDVMGSEFTNLSNAERQKTGASGGGAEERPKTVTNSAEHPPGESEQESLRRKPRQTRKQQQLTEQGASTKCASACTNAKPSGGKGNDVSKSHSSHNDDGEEYPEHATPKTRQVRSGSSQDGEQKSAGKSSFLKQSEAESAKSKLLAKRKTTSIEEPPLFVPDNLPPAVKKDGPKDHNAKSGNAKAGRMRSQKFEEESSTDLTETMSSALSDESDSENDPNKLWCICRQPYNNRFMICCDRCEDWFHGDCVGITVSRGRQMERNGEDYICPNCSSKEDESKQAGGADQDVQLGAKAESSTTLSEADAGAMPGKGTPAQAALHGMSDGPMPTNIQQGNIKGKIEKAKIVSDITKKKRILNRCAGTGCTKMAAPGSVYCSNDCILRHAAHTMQTLQKGQAKPAPLPSITRDSSLSVQPSGTRLDANPALRRNSSDKPVVVFERSNRVVLIKANVIHVPKPGSLVKQPQPATNAQLGSKANIPSSTFYNTVNKQKTDSTINNKKDTVTKDKKPELKRKSETPTPAPNDKLIRSNVRRSLGDIFAKRMKDSKSLKISEDEALKVADEIEKELYAQFQDTDSKYKNKYRSLMFNLKDARNHGLFRRVLKREIPPHKLVRMSPEELASKELAEWRERENKHTLEMIEKEQREIERRPITKITHKGEIEIEESTLQTAVEESTDSESILTEETETKVHVDTTEQHKLHLFDLNCKICTGKVAPPVEEPSAKKVKVATSVILATKKAAAEFESAAVTAPGPSKADAGTAKSAVSVSASSSVNANLEEQQTKSPVSVLAVRSAEQSAGDCRAYSFLDDIWKGFVNMQNVAKFATKVFAVSGSCDHMAEDLPDTIEVGGRIAPKVVWDYLEKVKATVTKEICLLRFYPATEEEKVGYVSLFSYFSSRNRFGVVANNCQYVKDMYLIPLGAYDDVPENLLPLDGPGLEQTRPNMLLGLVVRQRSKRRLPGEHPFDAPILYDKEHTILNSPDDKQRQVSSFENEYHHSIPEIDSIGRSTKYSEEPSNSSFVEDGISPLISMYSATTTGFYGTSDYTTNSLPLPPSPPPYVPENNVDPIVQNFATLDETVDEEEDHNTDDDEAYDPEDETLFTDNTRRFGQSSGMLSVRDKPPDMSMDTFLDTIVPPANVSLSEQQKILDNLKRQIAEEKRKLEEQEASLRQMPPLPLLPNAAENVESLSIQVNKSRDPRQSGLGKQLNKAEPSAVASHGSSDAVSNQRHEPANEGATEVKGKVVAPSPQSTFLLASRHDADPKRESRDSKQPSNLSQSEKRSGGDKPSEPSGSGNSHRNSSKEREHRSRRDSSESRSQQGGHRRSSVSSSDRGVEDRDRHEQKNARAKGGHTEQRWDRDRERQRGWSDERDRRRGWDGSSGSDKDWGRERDRDRDRDWERNSSERSRSNRERSWNRGRDHDSRDAGRSRDRDRSRH